MSRIPSSRFALPIFALTLLPATLGAQGLTEPPPGDNQKSEVRQSIGPVEIAVHYASPDVHGPDGADRRGKIWGEGHLVPYGYHEETFGTCGKKCPWRGGANENTVFSTSHPVEIEGKKLAAGSYGLHFLPGAEQWTVIFSKDSTSWGSFFYDEAQDALRVTVTPRKNEYREWLTYEFTDRRTDKARLELQWEEIAVPISIAVPNADELWVAGMERQLKNSVGFDYRSWQQAATFLLDKKILLDRAEIWARSAVEAQFVGQANFLTLSTLARAQAANGKLAEAKVSMDKALSDPSASVLDIHQYGRQLLSQGEKAEALRIFLLNAKRFGDAWPIHVGLTRGYSANGDFKKALKHAKLALLKAPDELNRNSVKGMIAKLTAGKDVN